MGLPSPLRLGLAAVVVLAMAGDVSAAEPTRITIGMSSVSIPGATARIAERMGMFEKHGLDATVMAMDNNNVATTALLSGSVNFVTSAPSDVIVAQARGQNVVALSSSYRGFAAVLVLSNAAIEKIHVSPTAPVTERLKALDGLIIATPSATSTFTVAPKSAAASVGAKIKLTYMSQPAMVAALKSGAVDGIVASAPFYVQPVLNGSGTIWINGPKGEFPSQSTPANSTVVMATREFAASHPELIERVIAAFEDFGRVAAEHPAEVKAAIARLYPDVDARTLDLLFETEAHGFAIGPLTVADMVHDLEFTKAGGLNVPGIDAIKPEALVFP